MPRRHLPQLWLMTDERAGAALCGALRRLPRGSGVVFRHHATAIGERRRLFAAILRIARARGLTVVRAGRDRMRGEGGVHNDSGPTRGLRTCAVHDAREAAAARRAGADLVFVSPVFATRSHPGAAALGPRRAAALARAARIPAIALGGMDAGRFATLRGFSGWAGIDAWHAPGTHRPHRKIAPRAPG